jgi:hypothetical protein
LTRGLSARKLNDMPGLLLALWLALQLTAAACAQPAPDAPAASKDVPVPAPTARNDDRDQDGLCDSTEERTRTNPDLLDTDADGFPDAVEVLANYNPTDPSTPGPDQLGYLLGQPGRMLDLELRSTIEGNGQGATGQFMARNAFDAYGLRASDFFVSALAVGAVPPDNVRGMSAGEERFASVLGKTRLTFRLHFEFAGDVMLKCVAALPFVYSIKSDTGGYMGSRDYLLVVLPNDSAVKPEDFCRPVACF